MPGTPLATRKRLITAKKETTYGVDAAPTGANAMLVKNLNAQPLAAESVSRELIQPYLGNSEQLLTQVSGNADFEVELAGSGIPGVAPAWAPLLLACGFVEELQSAPITITQTGGLATATLAGHGFSFGSKVKISGAAQPEYNGVFEIVGVTLDTFDFAVTGSPASPATGSPVVGTAAVYTPTSEDFSSLTLDYILDGLRHKLRGARGTASLTLNVKAIPVIKFTFTGLYTAPADITSPVPDFSKFVIPKVVNTLNTPAFNINGFTAPLEQMSLDLANDVQYRTLVGFEAVNIIDRRPAGSMVVEAPRIADHDFFSEAVAGDVGSMSITHGIASGNIVRIDAPRVSIQNPSYQDSQGVQMLSIPFVPVPEFGNDELVITVK